MPLGGQRDVGSEQAVPPRQVEAIVRIGPARIDGMLDAVRVGCEDEKPLHAVRSCPVVAIDEMTKPDAHLLAILADRLRGALR